MSKIYPEIRIKYGWLLTNATSKPMQEYWSPDETTRSAEESEEIAQKYRDFWSPHETELLDAMYDVTGLEFHQNTIDVYVVPWFYAFSNPLVLGVIFDTQEKLLVTLTHELCHRLLSDNKSHDDTKTLVEWEHIFGKHEKVALVHIPVYAILHKIFIDIIKKPEMLEHEIHNKQAYQEAWDYVQMHGYDKILQQLKQLYA